MVNVRNKKALGFLILSGVCLSFSVALAGGDEDQSLTAVPCRHTTQPGQPAPNLLMTFSDLTAMVSSYLNQNERAGMLTLSKEMTRAVAKDRFSWSSILPLIQAELDANSPQEVTNRFYRGYLDLSEKHLQLLDSLKHVISSLEQKVANANSTKNLRTLEETKIKLGRLKKMIFEYALKLEITTRLRPTLFRSSLAHDLLLLTSGADFKSQEKLLNLALARTTKEAGTFDLKVKMHLLSEANLKESLLRKIYLNIKEIASHGGSNSFIDENTQILLKTIQQGNSELNKELLSALLEGRSSFLSRSRSLLLAGLVQKKMFEPNEIELNGLKVSPRTELIKLLKKWPQPKEDPNLQVLLTQIAYNIPSLSPDEINTLLLLADRHSPNPLIPFHRKVEILVALAPNYTDPRNQLLEILTSSNMSLLVQDEVLIRESTKLAGIFPAFQTAIDDLMIKSKEIPIDGASLLYEDIAEGCNGNPQLQDKLFTLYTEMEDQPRVTKEIIITNLAEFSEGNQTLQLKLVDEALKYENRIYRQGFFVGPSPIEHLAAGSRDNPELQKRLLELIHSKNPPRMSVVRDICKGLEKAGVAYTEFSAPCSIAFDLDPLARSLLEQ